MKVLVIGSGGREHAICWKLKDSASVDAVYCLPGNPGISEIAVTEAVPVDDIEAILSFARSIKPDLTVVGPELPLSLGIVDAFRAEGLHIFGPVREAARLEASKAFAKEVMEAAGVPTAAYRGFSDMKELRAYVERTNPPLVLKADGLAAGKGVFVCLSREDLNAALEGLESMGKAASHVVAEEFLTGVEVSYIVATDGERVVPMASSHDYKRIFDNDGGPNTGGMGSVSPTPRLKADDEGLVIRTVIEPMLREMKRRGVPFQGFLYAGLMISPKNEIKVLEFNVRFGDPETQSILKRMEGDLAQLLYALTEKGSPLPEVRWRNESAVCVVMAAEGYPDTPKKGDLIRGIAEAETIKDVTVFHAGTARAADGSIRTNGGRVLNVTATGSSIAEARAKVYEACGRISFDGAQYRKDIAE